MAKTRGAIFYPEHVAVARGLLTDAEIGLLFLAVSDYADSGEIPEPPSKAWGVCFDLMRGAIDKNEQRYIETCERNKRNIEKRWSRQSDSVDESNGIPSNTTVNEGIPPYSTYTNQTKLNQTEPSQTEPSSNRLAKRFTPPSVEEVRAYCEERGNSVDAQRFVDYYASNGWRVGKNPMRDWKACVRTWERSQNSYQATAPAQRGGLHAIPSAEDYASGVDPSGFGWA